MIGNTPLKHKATPSDLLAIASNPDRHPNAISCELMRATSYTLQSLAYGEYAEIPLLADVPMWLAEAAYDELNRRALAVNNLRSVIFA